MDEQPWPVTDEPWKDRPARVGQVLPVSVNQAESEILAYLEGYGTTTLRELLHTLDWPTCVVTRAIGALIHKRHIRAVRGETDMSLEPVPASPQGQVWGG